jgi:photosystem II stability/assembly factor-like uncharacterized protein
VIIGTLVSLLGPRLAATLLALCLLAIAALSARADALPDSTWVALKPLPRQGSVAVFALAVDPSNNQVLIAGNSEGSILRSQNGGGTWATVHTGKPALTAIAFNPYTPGLVLAGTRGSGALASKDGGATWSPASGLDGRSVRAFGFALSVIAAGTDHGVFVSQDGFSWTSAGLAGTNINAVAVEAIHSPVRMVAAGDSQASTGILPFFQSTDEGTTWTQFNPPITGTIATKFAAGPLPPQGDTRPLMVGTNAGLFTSSDNGVSFRPLSGGALLPSTDYTQINFITDHFDRYYVASDGGGSRGGGLWRTNDAGRSFTSLAPPETSVTALAVSNDESPVLYVAAFRPTDHAALLWVYHDTFGTPRGPAASPTPVVSGARTAPKKGNTLLDLLALPEVPYVALGAVAVLLLLIAAVAHLRARHR